MVAKINVGNSLYGALAYNGEKVNEGQGRLLLTHKIFDDGTGTFDIRRAAEDFTRYLPEQVRTSKPVVHISLNPHPDDRLTDTELTAIAEEYLARLGYGNQPYAVFKHEDIDRHHLHIVTLCVDEQGKKIGDSFIRRRSKNITRTLEQQYGLHTAERKRQSGRTTPHGGCSGRRRETADRERPERHIRQVQVPDARRIPRPALALQCNRRGMSRRGARQGVSRLRLFRNR